MDNTAKILDGKKLSSEIIMDLKDKVAKLPTNLPKPKLVVVIVGNDFASKVYVRNKNNICKKIGYLSQIKHLDENATFEDVANCINELNNDEHVHAILLQVPLPKHLWAKQEQLLQQINPFKDVDCFNFENFGKIVRNVNPIVYPCTAKGIIDLVQKYNIPIKGANITVIGFSNIVGKPTAIMLEHLGATVTICNVSTKDIKFYTLNADIIITATGVKNVITFDMVKKGVVLIDAGIIRNEQNKVSGDVNFNQMKNVCSYITPVPGGVGPMTIATLMSNLWLLYKLKEKF